jgi:hypothetical protein
LERLEPAQRTLDWEQPLATSLALALIRGFVATLGRQKFALRLKLPTMPFQGKKVVQEEIALQSPSPLPSSKHGDESDFQKNGVKVLVGYLNCARACARF